jgi:hypothetical protein
MRWRPSAATVKRDDPGHGGCAGRPDRRRGAVGTFGHTWGAMPRHRTPSPRTRSGLPSAPAGFRPQKAAVWDVCDGQAVPQSTADEKTWCVANGSSRPVAPPRGADRSLRRRALAAILQPPTRTRLGRCQRRGRFAKVRPKKREGTGLRCGRNRPPQYGRRCGVICRTTSIRCSRAPRLGEIRTSRVCCARRWQPSIGIVWQCLPPQGNTCSGNSRGRSNPFQTLCGVPAAECAKIAGDREASDDSSVRRLSGCATGSGRPAGGIGSRATRSARSRA